MPVLKLTTPPDARQNDDAHRFSASVTRFNNELLFMKTIVEESDLDDRDKLAIMSDFIRISGMMLEVWEKLSLSLAKTR